MGQIGIDLACVAARWSLVLLRCAIHFMLAHTFHKCSPTDTPNEEITDCLGVYGRGREGDIIIINSNLQNDFTQCPGYAFGIIKITRMSRKWQGFFLC